MKHLAEESHWGTVVQGFAGVGWHDIRQPKPARVTVGQFDPNRLQWSIELRTNCHVEWVRIAWAGVSRVVASDVAGELLVGVLLAECHSDDETIRVSLLGEAPQGAIVFREVKRK
jgi:hypothetical protein